MDDNKMMNKGWHGQAYSRLLSVSKHLIDFRSVSAEVFDFAPACLPLHGASIFHTPG